MNSPFHQHASVPLAGHLDEVTRRLHEDADAVAAAATANAWGATAPRLRSWGVGPLEPPQVEVVRGDDDAFGSLAVIWTGDETRTGWPAMQAGLITTVGPCGQGRLALIGARPPRLGLAASRLDQRNRRRILDTAVQRFLRDTAFHLDAQAPRSCTHRTPASFDRRPSFVHAVRDVHSGAVEVARHLADEIEDLAPSVTQAAVAAAKERLDAGRFRAVATPSVSTAAGRLGELATVRIRWSGDEEATGWPALDLALAVVALPDGRARLVAHSTREPAYDLSRNRGDKQVRHDVLARAAGDVLDALVPWLEADPRSGVVPDDAALLAVGDRREATIGA